MYAYISGLIVSVLESSIIVDNQGIGYEIFTPNPNVYKEGTEAILYTFHYVREDTQSLFGFETPESLSFFKKIITVKGIGPKTGLAILSKTSLSNMVSAIENSDVNFLKSLPGIGPKMASQMVLDLKGKLVEGIVKNPSNQAITDVFDTLSSLGFKRSELNSIKKTLTELNTDDVDLLLRHGLKLLSR